MAPKKKPEQPVEAPPKKGKTPKGKPATKGKASREQAKPVAEEKPKKRVKPHIKGAVRNAGRTGVEALTQREEALVKIFVSRGHELTRHQMGVQAGYKDSTGTAQMVCEALSHPRVIKAIREMKEKIDGVFVVTQAEILQRAHDVYMARAWDVAEWDEKRKVTPISPEKMNRRGHALINGIKFKEGEFGDEIEFKFQDRLGYGRLLAHHAGLSERSSIVRHRNTPEQAQAIRSVREGTLTATQACLDLELAGQAIPETLYQMMLKTVTMEAPEDPGAGSGMDFTNPEAIAELMKARAEKMAAIDRERDEFLPKRRDEVRQIKEELGKANKAFDKPGKPGGDDPEPTED